MIAVVIILGIALLLFIIGIFLFFGKGKSLITGYNMASQEEKEKYDEKKLCRAVSMICAVCAVMLCIMAYMGYRVETGVMNEDEMLPFGMIFMVVIVVSILVATLYINTKAKKK